MEALIEDDRRGLARRIAADGERAAVGVAERPLEAFRNPVAARVRDLVDPQAQVAPNRGDLVVPDPVDCRRELLVLRLGTSLIATSSTANA